MLKLIVVLFVCWLAAPAIAADVTVNEPDQKAIAQICSIAAKSPAISDQQTVQIAQWCVVWANRMDLAGKEPPKLPPTAENKK